MRKYNNYQIEICGDVTVWIDNYENDQISYGVNSWSLDAHRLNVSTLSKINLSRIRKCIQDYLNEVLYSELKTKKFREGIAIGGDKLHYSQYTNPDNTGEPTKKDFKKWRDGLADLYVQDIILYVNINGVRVDSKDLAEIINN